MKTLKQISVLFAFLLLSSGIYAQSCYLTINDPNNSGNQNYNYSVALYDFDVSTTVPRQVVSGTDIWINSGDQHQIVFTFNFAPDKYNLYFRAYARNTSNLRSDEEWSPVFDSGDYYNGVPVTLNIP